MLTIIANICNNNVIGRDGDLVVNLPEDMKNFRDLTLGSTVIMGRKTWLSLPVKPLPKRTNIVLSSLGSLACISGAIVTSELMEVADYYSRDCHDAYVIGGSQIYEKFLPYCKRMILTRTYADIEGDTYFPEFNSKDWNKKILKSGISDGYKYVIFELNRKDLNNEV